MSEEKEKVDYKWLHPDVIAWQRDGKTQGYLFRTWAILNLDLEHFELVKSRFYFQTPSSLDIVSTYKLDKHLDQYNALAPAEKKERLSDKHYLAEVADNDGVDGYRLFASTEVPEDFRVYCASVDDFEGKTSDGWHPTPFHLKKLDVSLVPCKRRHGGLYRRDETSVNSLQISIEPDLLSGVLDDLNSSNEKKKIQLSFSVLLWEFHQEHYGPDSHGSERTQLHFMPYNKRSTLATLNSINVTLYERKPQPDVTLIDADLSS